jgi:hypothetical protein
MIFFLELATFQKTIGFDEGFLECFGLRSLATQGLCACAS